MNNISRWLREFAEDGMDIPPHLSERAAREIDFLERELAHVRTELAHVRTALDHEASDLANAWNTLEKIRELAEGLIEVRKEDPDEHITALMMFVIGKDILEVIDGEESSA